MGGGGKSSKQETKIDPRLEAAALDTMDYAATLSKVPYQPNRGVQIAAFNPTQKGVFKNIASSADAFNMNSASGDMNLPKAQNAGNGIMGYSTGKVYDAAKDRSMSNPMQKSIDLLFANAKTGNLYSKESPLFQQIYGDRSGKGGGDVESTGAVATNDNTRPSGSTGGVRPAPGTPVKTPTKAPGKTKPSKTPAKAPPTSRKVRVVAKKGGKK